MERALKTKPGCMQSSGKPGIRGKGKKKKYFGGEKIKIDSQ